MNHIRDRISHAQSNRRKSSISVEAWPDEKGDPTVLYFTELTAGEAAALAPKINGDNEESQIYALVDTIILKTLDADGNKVFTDQDRELLLNESPTVLSDIGECITNLAGTVEEAAKN